MQTPQKDAPQSARKSSKQHNLQPDLPNAVQSDNDAYLVTPQEGSQTPSRKNRKPRKASNARKNGVQSDAGEFQQEHEIHRPSSHAARPKNTPAKAIRSDAYAGPTFHQSPAPSAIPMPSFFSKSVPNNAAISTIAETTDGSSDSRQAQAREIEEKRETTPLDWMFNAARQARGTPNGASPARLLSPLSRSPAPSPAGRREEADFPFELDDEPRSVYSTPLTQRLAASKTTHSTSEGGQSMTDEERKVKSAALKQALMNSASPSQSPGPLGPPFNDNNPFNAKNAPATPSFPPRHPSNSNTAAYQNGYMGNQPNQSFQYPPLSPSRNYNMQPTNRPPSSNLRNVYEPAPSMPTSPPNTAPEQREYPAGPPMSPRNIAPDRRVSTARSPQPPPRQLNFEAIYGGSSTPTSRPQSEGNSTVHNTKPSLEQGLDDLKKALNMNFLRQA